MNAKHYEIIIFRKVKCYKSIELRRLLAHNTILGVATRSFDWAEKPLPGCFTARFNLDLARPLRDNNFRPIAVLEKESGTMLLYPNARFIVEDGEVIGIDAFPIGCRNKQLGTVMIIQTKLE